MPIDNSGDFKPPASSEHKPTITEKLSGLRTKIENIFSKRELPNQTPKQTLEELAAIEIPQDIQKQAESAIGQLPEPKLITPDTTPQDQSEINQLTQSIKAITPENQPSVESAAEAPKPPERTLFPDRPSLYQQHHQEYDRECRTLKGKITRHKDIKILKKEGVDDAVQVYDGLRSRGINRDQIMQDDSKQKSRFAPGKNIYPWEIDRQPIPPQTLPKMIDRLYKIYSFDPNSFTSDENFESLNDKAKAISIQTDEQFNQMYSQLNQYPFLHESSSVCQLFSKPNLPENLQFTLNFLQQSYFSDPDNIRKINSLLPKNPNIFHSLYYGSYLDIITVIAQSDINPDEKISLPEEIKQNDVWLKGFDNLDSRDFQRYFSDERRYFDKPDRWFDTNSQPKIAFFENFLRFTDRTEPIKIPNQTINSIDNHELKVKWEFISKLPDIYLQKNAAYLINPGQYYFYGGKPNIYTIYRTLFSQRQILGIIQNHFSEFSSDTQEKIISAWVTNHLSRGNIDSYSSYDNPDIGSGIKKILGDSEQIDSFLNKDNLPTSHFFEVYIQNTDHSNIDQFLHSHLTKGILSSFSQEDQNFWNTILNLHDNQITLLLVKSKSDSQSFSQERFPQYLSVINEINNSPSKEILKIKNQLLIEIFGTTNPLETYQKVLDIFTKNNLPMVGKIYRVFNAIYPTERLNQILSDNELLSRVLTKTHSSRLRQSIIFNDLLKVNLGSGESSLTNYLNFLNQSSATLEKARSGNQLSPSEVQQLSLFFRKLDTLYDSSLLSRLQSQKPFDASTLQIKISELYQKYNVKKGQSISDRVAEMYLFGLGLKTIPEALSYIQKTKESAHQRNLSQTDFSLHPGDLVKGVLSENLGNILNFGCVAGEYLGSDAKSDSTPFDTDTIKSDSVYQPNEITSVGLKGYGDLFIVIKDRGQLQNTTDIQNPTYDSSKLEIFYSQVQGANHFGIRTGFPSSEIDFLVATDTNPQKLANIYFQISSHGVYIPVLDNQGNILFTPDYYKKYRLNTELINQTLSESNFVPSKLINLLKSVPYLQTLYETDSGVFEKYSVGQHTQMVMTQFEKYFSKQYQSDILTLEEFRLLLSLHDIGKGEAVSKTGSTTEQHIYTKKIAKNILTQSNISEKSSDIIIGLIDQDILGEYFKGKISDELASKKIHDLSKILDIPSVDLINTLKMFYICDAGAYTSDAGGIASLDRLFNFDPNNGKVAFSESTETKYQKLVKSLSSGDAR